MNTDPNARAIRPFYWSVRRELFEHRSIYVAPLAVGAVLIVGMVIAALFVSGPVDGAAADPAQLRAAIAEPFAMATRMIMLTSFIVGFFYCLDALYGERRDRSILFWKSLPVSDRTAVFAKASIPMIVLPAITFAIVLVTQLIMMVFGTFGLMMRGSSASTAWSLLMSSVSPLTVLYALVGTALWHAPTYGWLLLVSSWARRMPVLWALLPAVVINVVERVAFGTRRIDDLLNYRGLGEYRDAYVNARGLDMAVAPVVGDFTKYMTPVQFLSTPGLWIGLLIAVALFAAAVYMRRIQQPI